MLIENYDNVNNNFGDFCDKIMNKRETLMIITGNNENLVLMPYKEYELLKKTLNNLEYILKAYIPK